MAWCTWRKDKFAEFAAWICGVERAAFTGGGSMQRRVEAINGFVNNRQSRMVWSTTGGSGNFRSRKQAEEGFSLIEVLISMVILTVGMVSLLGVFGLAMSTTQASQQNMIAKQLANEAYESIITARNTSQISWDEIQNASACSGNTDPGTEEFHAGANADLQLGSRRIYGTCDDTGSTPLLEVLADPGPDGIYNTTDIPSSRSRITSAQFRSTHSTTRTTIRSRRCAA